VPGPLPRVRHNLLENDYAAYIAACLYAAFRGFYAFPLAVLGVVPFAARAAAAVCCTLLRRISRRVPRAFLDAFCSRRVPVAGFPWFSNVGTGTTGSSWRWRTISCLGRSLNSPPAATRLGSYLLSRVVCATPSRHSAAGLVAYWTRLYGGYRRQLLAGFFAFCYRPAGRGARLCAHTPVYCRAAFFCAVPTDSLLVGLPLRLRVKDFTAHIVFVRC